MSKLRSIEEYQTLPQNRPQNHLDQPLAAVFPLQYTQKMISTGVAANEIGNQQKFDIQLQPGLSLLPNLPKVAQLDGSHGEEWPKQALVQKMDKLYNSLSREYFEIIQDLDQIDEADQIEEVEDFILKIHPNQLNQVPKVLAILQSNACLRGFLQWIFDAAPLLFYQDLILVACRLISLDLPCLSTQLLENGMGLSRNINFIYNILNDSSLDIFKVVFQDFNANHHTTNSLDSLVSLISFYSQIILELKAKDQNEQEQEETERQTKQCQESKKAKKSKKIQKVAKSEKKKKCDD